MVSELGIPTVVLTTLRQWYDMVDDGSSRVGVSTSAIDPLPTELTHPSVPLQDVGESDLFVICPTHTSAAT